MNRTGVVILETAADCGLLYWVMVIVMTIVEFGMFSIPSVVPGCFCAIVTLTDDISKFLLR